MLRYLSQTARTMLLIQIRKVIGVSDLEGDCGLHFRQAKGEEPVAWETGRSAEQSDKSLNLNFGQSTELKLKSVVVRVMIGK